MKRALKKIAAWFFACRLNVADVLLLMLFIQPFGQALREVFGSWIALPAVVAVALLWSFLSALGEFFTQGWGE